MTISEFFAEYEIRRPAQKGDYAGGMTVGDIEQIKAEAAKSRTMKARAKARQDVATTSQD